VSAPDPQPLDLSTPRRIHVVGLGGSGMSAIAEVLRGTGHHVSGSDLTASRPLERLAAEGMTTFVGHAASQVGEAEAVAVSSAIPADNPEVVEAIARGIPVLRRAEVLTAVTRAWRTVAVAGTHGKTTTSAMLTAALRGAGLDPSFIVGGDLRDLGRGAGVGRGDLLVVEADESDGTFVELSADAVVVTNVEPDHLEHYGGYPGLVAAFERFVDQASGPRIICIDDPGARALAERSPAATTYGVDAAAHHRIVDVVPTPDGVRFEVVTPSATLAIQLRQPGLHNARNATAALAAATALGADPAAAAEALTAFGGVGRRFERRGEAAGVTMVDDYAHLPTEVAAAIAAARSLAPTRLVAVFQPHRYSRTEQLWSTFTDAFADADVLVVTGIYTAGEAPRPGISGRLIADDVARAHPEAAVHYVEDLDDVVAELGGLLRPGDLCLTLGAGDLTTIPDRLLAALGER
jgi:UDP-N-acetylmuramate--alanine ligase